MAVYFAVLSGANSVKEFDSLTEATTYAKNIAVSTGKKVEIDVVRSSNGSFSQTFYKYVNPPKLSNNNKMDQLQKDIQKLVSKELKF